jgi:hypothetical protein
MNHDKIAQTSFLGCKWIDLQRCKWYEVGKKRRIKIKMQEICKNAGISL